MYELNLRIVIDTDWKAIFVIIQSIDIIVDGDCIKLTSMNIFDIYTVHLV